MKAMSLQELQKALLDMVISFQFPPDTKLSESQIARQFGVSRTPVRQALQELATKKLLIQRPAKGFFTRKIEKDEIFDLYELRECIEMKAVHLAAQRATDEELKGLYELWERGQQLPEDSPTAVLHKRDRDFHMYIADIGNNKQVMHLLSDINDRIFFVRWIDMTERSDKTQQEHKEVALLLKERRGQEAAAVMSKHINKRMEDIEKSIREAYARIYTGQLPMRN